MCGILGGTHIQAEKPFINGLRSFSYRGPDHTGYSTVDTVFLGNNRLSVIDLDPRSNQPIQSEEGNRIVFNGEIYNFRELQEMLRERGCAFKTDSDTEVILRGYEKLGTSFFGMLRGMFAFAIHDVKRNSVILARDSIGIKPLLYSLVAGELCFASELKGITTALPRHAWSIDTDAISLLFGYGAIPSPLTIYTEVKKLRAGYFLEYDLSTHSVVREELIQIPCTQSHSNDDVTRRLYESIQAQLVSDVPVGLFFSGGIDSSLIAAILKEQKVSLKAYSLQIEQKQGDALYSKKIAESLKLDVTYVPFGIPEFESALQSVQSRIDEPSLDSSMLALYYLAQKAGNQVKVVLSGEGADELFYGYARQLDIATMRPWVRIDAVINFLYTHTPRFRGRSKLFSWLYRNFASKYSYYLFATSPRQQSGGWKWWYDWFKNSRIDATDLDESLYLENDLLRKIDLATSYASIEGRVPFLDQSLWKQVKHHRDLSVEKGMSKFTLKNLLCRYVPEEYVYRPKSGMGLPMEKIFRESTYVQHLFLEAREYLGCITPLHKFKMDLVEANPRTEPYFCYIMLTLFLTLKNTGYRNHREV
jgi:asparagine synthase (glutamine-hydrolysing)